MMFIDFSILLCSVTQGNHAKHKPGARFVHGWRKCFLACVDYLNIYIYMIYLNTILSKEVQVEKLPIYERRRTESKRYRQVKGFVK